MKNHFKLIITIIILIKNILIRKKIYKLKFIKKEDNDWYYDFQHFNLTANAKGLNDFLNAYNQYDTNNKEIKLIFIPSKTQNKQKYNDCDEIIGLPLYQKPNTIKLDKYKHGRKYIFKEKNINLYVCPLTLFILGHYPNYTYVKNITNE